MRFSKQRRNRYGVGLAIVVGLAIAAAVASTLSRGDRPAWLAGATRVAPVSRDFSEASYEWLDNHTIVAGDVGDPPAKITTYDLTTHKSTIERLAPPLPASHPPDPGSDVYGPINPDGAHILWVGSNTIRLVSRRDGSMRTMMQYASADVGGAAGLPHVFIVGNCAWLPGGRLWVTAESAAWSGQFVVIRDLNGKIVRRGALNGPTDFTCIAGIMRNGDLLVYRGDGERYEVSLTPRIAVVRSWPATSGETALLLSPDGSRLLWWESDSHMSAFHQIAGRLFHHRTYDEVATISVSDPDGSHKRTLANVTWETHDPYAPNPIDDFRWLPDSRHFSFVYKNAIWVRPV